MKRKLVVMAFASAALVVGCDKNDDQGEGTDAGATCFENPTTHVEIINACTTAEAFDKTPNLPLLLSDGGLPPLP